VLAQTVRESVQHAGGRGIESRHYEKTVLAPHWSRADPAHNHVRAAHGATYGCRAHPHGPREATGGGCRSFLGYAPERFSGVSALLDPKFRPSFAEKSPKKPPRGAQAAPRARTGPASTHQGRPDPGEGLDGAAGL
jgi:hypothetical protein